MLKFYTKCRNLIIVCVVAMIAHSCNFINPAEQIPTYIHIDSFQFKGKGTSEIKSVVVYYNNNPVGSFDLPVTFPVKATGNGVLLVTPCISANGQSDRMTPYPFYTSDTFSFAAQPGSIINHVPVANFVTAAKFNMLSDFEVGLIHMSKSGGNIPIVVTTDKSLVFEGGGSGSILLSAVGDSSIDSTNVTFPITPGAAFIEFDYKTEIPFAVGMEANLNAQVYSGQYYIAGLNPTTGWRKFYLNLTGYISAYPATSYSFFLKTVDQTTGRLLIDNIKLVTF